MSGELCEALIKGAGSGFGFIAMVAVLIYLITLLADWRDRYNNE